jgi:ABC-2 type transport system permease protein
VPLTILGAWLITFSAMLMIGTLGLFFESSLAGYDLWLGLYFIFSGYLLPLELFPSWLLRFVRFSPFPYVLSFPVETMLGLQTRVHSLEALGMQWLYVAFFFASAIMLWRRGVRRYAAYGG